MHTPYLTIEEGIEFPKVSPAKQMPGKSLEAKQIGRMGKECSIVFYNPFTTILLT
jgi:hypothetical protein